MGELCVCVCVCVEGEVFVEAVSWGEAAPLL